MLCCKVYGCKSPRETKRLCSVHFERLLKYRKFKYKAGANLHTKIGGDGEPIRWLKKHIVWSSDDCLYWPFSRNDKGYGNFKYRSKTLYACQAMCFIVHGPAPVGKRYTLHSCRNAANGCCNPWHLRWGTMKENMHDRLRDGTSNRGNHRNGNTHLTVKQVREIRILKGIEPQRTTGNRYGVSARTVGSIQNREWWAWLD